MYAFGKKIVSLNSVSVEHRVMSFIVRASSYLKRTKNALE